MRARDAVQPIISESCVHHSGLTHFATLRNKRRMGHGLLESWKYKIAGRITSGELDNKLVYQGYEGTECGRRAVRWRRVQWDTDHRATALGAGNEITTILHVSPATRPKRMPPSSSGILSHGLTDGNARETLHLRPRRPKLAHLTRTRPVPQIGGTAKGEGNLPIGQGRHC